MLATGLCFGAAWVTARVVSADVLGFTETFFLRFIFIILIMRMCVHAHVEDKF